jgi:hypothetical protein
MAKVKEQLKQSERSARSLEKRLKKSQEEN